MDITAPKGCQAFLPGPPPLAPACPPVPQPGSVQACLLTCRVSRDVELGGGPGGQRTWDSAHSEAWALLGTGPLPLPKPYLSLCAIRTALV